MPTHRRTDKDDVMYIYNGKLLSHKKNEMLPFTIKQMNLEGIILREISQTEKANTIGSHLYVESKDKAK